MSVFGDQTTANVSPEVTAKNRWTWLLAAGIAALYFGSLSREWSIGRDSALYLMLGESLQSGNGYTLWGQPHLYVPPLFPLWLSAMFRVGLGDMLWLNLSMCLCGLGTLWVGYLLVRELTTPGLASAVTAVVALSPELHGLSLRQQSDVPFMLVTSCGVLCYARAARGHDRWLEAGTMALAASCWLRVVGFPFAAFAALGLLVQRGRDSSRRVWLNVAVLATALSLTAAGFLYWQQSQQTALRGSYGHQLETLGQRPVGRWLLQPVLNFHQTAGHYARLLTGQKLDPSLAIVLLVIPTLTGLWCLARRREWVVVLVAVGYVGSVLLLRPMLARYLLPVAPLLVAALLEGVRLISERLTVTWRWRGVPAAIACAVVFAAVSLPKDLRAVYRARSAVAWRQAEPAWVSQQQTADFLRQAAQPNERFLASDDNRSLAYLSGLPSLELSTSWQRRTTSLEDIRHLLDQQGVRFLVFRSDVEWLPFAQRLHQISKDSSDFVEVYRNEHYRVCGKARDHQAEAEVQRSTQ